MRTAEHPRGAGTGSTRRTGLSRAASFALPATGVVGAVATVLGFASLGDTPDPHDPDTRIAAFFADNRDTVLGASPLGWTGDALLLAFLLGVVRELPRRSPAVALARFAAYTFVAYLAGLWLAWTTLAYAADGTSAGAQPSRLLFIATITASPVAGGAVAALLLTVAVTATDGLLGGRGYRLVTGAGGLLAGAAVFGHAEAGFFYPDVQQQYVANVAVLWVLLTAGVLAASRNASRATWSPSRSGRSSP
jgi:hypothetical protein